MSLKQRTFRSARWNVLRAVVVNSLQLVQLAVLARLLEPAHFGEVAVVLVILMFADLLSQTGVDLHLMSRRGKIQDLLHPTWSLQVVRGAFLTLIIASLAGPVAYYQDSSRLFFLMLAMSAVPLLDGLRSVGPIVLARELDQARIVISEMIVMAVSSATAFVIAYYWRSPWALACNTLVFTVLKTLASYCIHPHRPRFTLRWGSLRSALRFGVYVNLAMTSSYFLISVDKFVLGRVFGHELLGYYERAFLLANVASLYLPRFLAATIVPSFAQLAQNRDRFRFHTRRYLRLLVAAFTLGPLVMYLAAGPIFQIAYGAKLAPGLPYFKILCLHAAFSGMTLGITTLFVLLGRAHLFFRCNLVQFGVLALVLPASLLTASLEAVCFAMNGAALAGLLACCFCILRGALEPEPEATAGPAEATSVPEARTEDSPDNRDGPVESDGVRGIIGAHGKRPLAT